MMARPFLAEMDHCAAAREGVEACTHYSIGTLTQFTRRTLRSAFAASGPIALCDLVGNRCGDFHTDFAIARRSFLHVIVHVLLTPASHVSMAFACCSQPLIRQRHSLGSTAHSAGPERLVALDRAGPCFTSHRCRNVHQALVAASVGEKAKGLDCSELSLTHSAGNAFLPSSGTNIWLFLARPPSHLLPPIEQRPGGNPCSRTCQSFMHLLSDP